MKREKVRRVFTYIFLSFMSGPTIKSVSVIMGGFGFCFHHYFESLTLFLIYLPLL